MRTTHIQETYAYECICTHLHTHVHCTSCACCCQTTGMHLTIQHVDPCCLSRQSSLVQPRLCDSTVYMDVWTHIQETHAYECICTHLHIHIHLSDESLDEPLLSRFLFLSFSVLPMFSAAEPRSKITSLLYPMEVEICTFNFSYLFLRQSLNFSHLS